MRFADAIDAYLDDMRREGRIRSKASERFYRDVLNVHATDVSNRDPRTTNREDAKTTLARWANPNSRAGRRSVLISFYDWAMQEGHRKDNPARQTRKSRKIPAKTYQLDAAELVALWNTATTELERRSVRLGLGAGLRSAELRGLQRRHLERPGLIWVSPDIAKGGRERWVPVIAELEPLIEEILNTIGPHDYVLYGQINASPGRNTIYRPVHHRPMGATTLWRLVRGLGVRAGIAAEVYPHMLRHAYADHVARQQGIRLAQALLGHADIRTTRGYIDEPTIDELRAAGAQLRLLTGHPPAGGPANPLMETAGIEPAVTPARPLEPKTQGRTLALALLELRESFLPLIERGA